MSGSQSSVITGSSEHNSPRKKCNPDEHVRNETKDSRPKGESFVGLTEKQVSAKLPGSLCCCNKKCLEKLGEENCCKLFTKLQTMKTKNEQDLFLYGLIEVKQIQRRRPRNELPRMNSAFFKYNLLIGTTRLDVCLKAFCSALDVSIKRIRRIRNLKQAGHTPYDRRGKHVNLPDATKAKVREHIESFPLKESYYLGENIFFFSPDPSLKTMHSLYNDKYPDLKVSYAFYLKLYNELSQLYILSQL